MKKYMCAFQGCGKSFVCESKLKDHMNVHMGLNIYQCGVCKKKYFSNKSLNAHKKRHFVDESIVCNMCGVIVQDLYLYKKHVYKVHTMNLFCEICSKDYTRKKNYERHMEMHKENKTNKLFVCKICGMSYQSKWNLEIHTGSIHENKKYRCDICSIEYSHQSSYNKHNKKHHKQ